MADALTSTTSLSAEVLSSVDQFVRAELRHSPILRRVADTRPVQVDRPGSSVALYINSDLAPATTPLNETTDPDAVALPNPTPVTLTPNEYGNLTISTIKVKTTAFADVDPQQMNAVAWNMRDTLDVLVRDVVSAGDNVRFAGDATTTDTLDAADTLTSADVRWIVTKLRTNAAQGKRGDLYWAGIHPDVSHDLKAETGAGSWRESHQYAAPGVFWPGEVGVYEGAFFVESARMKVADNAAATPIPVYRTIFAGKEALAEGVQIEPHTVVGNIPDKFGRFFPLGWYGFLGWSVFRQKSLYRLESASSVA